MLTLFNFIKRSSCERKGYGDAHLCSNWLLTSALNIILQFLVLLKFSDGASYVKLLTKLNIIRPLEVYVNT